MLARWTGFTFPGATAYAGYAMAGSAFFALAHTLNEDGHIRVKILLSKLGDKKRLGEEGKEILRRKLKQLKITLNEASINELVNYFKLKTSLDLFYSSLH